MLSHFSHVRFFATLWTVACQSPLSMGFSRLKYAWVFVPSSNDLSHPRIEPTSPIVSLAQADSLPLSTVNLYLLNFNSPLFSSCCYPEYLNIYHIYFSMILSFSEFKFLKSKLITFLLPCGAYHGLFHRVFVGREKLAKMVCPGSLVSHW